MKVALVHDYLNEFGGAERVLLALSEIWPKAPIYTAFYRKGSVAYDRFKDKSIRSSWVQKVPFFNTKLHSPLRFLAPFIWNSFDFSDYDLVFTSSSWYVTRGFAKKGPRTVEICYCHTPPRYLWGYETSIQWQKHFLVRMYALIVNHFMRVYDFNSAQKVDYFIANSQNVKKRIWKFYRRDAEVIYPPVDLPPVSKTTNAKRLTQKGYFLVVSRIVGGKGLALAVETMTKLGLPLKVVGKPAGWAHEYEKLKKMAGEAVEFLGFVSDEELVNLYSGARALLVLSKDEDFGITPVEAMLCGTPVIAYKGGGYLETVVEGKTGVFFNPATSGSLTMAINYFMELEKKGVFSEKAIKKHAQKFGKERFKKEIAAFVKSKVK